MAFACSVWAEEIAKLKGHNPKQWLVLGLLFGPAALIALAGYPDLEDRKHQRDSAAELSIIKDDIDAMRRGKEGLRSLQNRYPTLKSSAGRPMPPRGMCPLRSSSLIAAELFRSNISMDQIDVDQFFL